MLSNSSDTFELGELEYKEWNRKVIRSGVYGGQILNRFNSKMSFLSRWKKMVEIELQTNFQKRFCYPGILWKSLLGHLGVFYISMNKCWNILFCT